jgi:hypothetical protein
MVPIDTSTDTAPLEPAVSGMASSMASSKAGFQGTRLMIDMAHGGGPRLCMSAKGTPPSGPYTQYKGYLGKGSDVLVGNYTMPDAQKLCDNW